MERADALHLLRRTGFTVRPAELDEIAALSREAAIDRLMDFGPNGGVSPPPSALDREGKRWQQVRDLRIWWLDRMRTAPRQLQEKMVLFWHSHFATNAESVYYAKHMWDQNQLFREQDRLAIGGLTGFGFGWGGIYTLIQLLSADLFGAMVQINENLHVLPGVSGSPDLDQLPPPCHGLWQ